MTETRQPEILQALSLSPSKCEDIHYLLYEFARTHHIMVGRIPSLICVVLICIHAKADTGVDIDDDKELFAMELGILRFALPVGSKDVYRYHSNNVMGM